MTEDDEKLLAFFDRTPQPFGFTQTLPAGTPPLAEAMNAAFDIQKAPIAEPIEVIQAKPAKPPRKPRTQPPADPDWTWRTRRMDGLLSNHELDVLNQRFTFGEAIEQVASLQKDLVKLREAQRADKRDMDMARDAILLDGSIDGKNEAIRSAQLSTAVARHTGYRAAEASYYQVEGEISVTDANISLWLRRIKLLEMDHALLVAQLEVLAR